MPYSSRLLRTTGLVASILLALLALGSCSSSAASGAGATPTCPTTQQGQITRATGTVTALRGNQITLQTTTGQVMVQLLNKTGFGRLQAVSQSALQDGLNVQVGVMSNSDGSYTAQTVIILSQSGNGGKGSGGGTPTGGKGGGSSGTPTCSGGTSKGGAGGSAGLDLLNGQTALSGVVATVSSQSLIITGQDGNDYSLKLGSATIYASFSSAQQSDLQVGQTVEVFGVAGSNGGIQADRVLILVGIPASQ